MRGIELRRSGLDGRMEYLADNWGSLASGLGVLLSAAGVVYAYLARRAAKSAEAASREARQAIAQTLTAADLQRAVALVERLLSYHRAGRWAVALERYGELRQMLQDIKAYLPEGDEPARKQLSANISEITEVISQVTQAVYNGTPPDDANSINDTLSAIQQNLEELASRLRFNLPNSRV